MFSSPGQKWSVTVYEYSLPSPYSSLRRVIRQRRTICNALGVPKEEITRAFFVSAVIYVRNNKNTTEYIVSLLMFRWVWIHQPFRGYLTYHVTFSLTKCCDSVKIFSVQFFITAFFFYTYLIYSKMHWKFLLTIFALVYIPAGKLRQKAKTFFKQLRDKFLFIN